VTCSNRLADGRLLCGGTGLLEERARKADWIARTRIIVRFNASYHPLVKTRSWDCHMHAYNTLWQSGTHFSKTHSCHCEFFKTLLSVLPHPTPRLRGLSRCATMRPREPSFDSMLP
jgi:hypothetical protein